MPNQINRAAPKQAPVMTMITHGRRSLGEAWRKINIYPDPDTGTYIIDNQPTEAPADNLPIFVPGMGNVSVEMADFILERSRHEAETRAKRPRRSEAEVWQEINEAWQDYMQQKLAWSKGRTTIGPGGAMQRERSPDRHGKR